MKDGRMTRCACGRTFAECYDNRRRLYKQMYGVWPELAGSPNTETTGGQS